MGQPNQGGPPGGLQQPQTGPPGGLQQPVVMNRRDPRRQPKQVRFFFILEY